MFKPSLVDTSLNIGNFATLSSTPTSSMAMIFNCVVN